MGAHKTPTERLAIIRDFYTSGFNVPNYCKSHNIANTTLRDWLKEFNKQNGITNKNDFISITTALKNNSLIESEGIITQKTTPIIEETKPIQNSIIKLKHPNGYELEFDVSILDEVMRKIS